MLEEERRSDAPSLINAAAHGDSLAASRLLELVYDELRKLARAKLAHESSGQTLQATALVHEAYVRLLGPEGVDRRWSGTAQFFAAAAEAMRRILIDRARARGAWKRGGGAVRIALDPERIAVDEVPDGLIELDEALARFTQESPEKAMLVRLRVYAGLTLPQAADVLGISMSTADRHWRSRGRGSTPRLAKRSRATNCVM
jgi:RNA polymerase sigma factor (TIGR02999 family)